MSRLAPILHPATSLLCHNRRKEGCLFHSHRRKGGGRTRRTGSIGHSTSQTISSSLEQLFFFYQFTIAIAEENVSTSELQGLVYLYRTVVYGVEMRNRKEKESDPSDTPRSATTTTPPAKKKPLGPRSSPSSPSSPSPPPRTASLPEDKFHFESTLAAAAKGGFAQFPLVEDDLDSTAVSSKEVDYTTPRTPFHSPSQSPRSTSPQPFLHQSPSLDAVASHFVVVPK